MLLIYKLQPLPVNRGSKLTCLERRAGAQSSQKPERIFDKEGSLSLGKA